ncbi:succinate dehydrogenase assembly factor 4, mitochondrial [Periophthalmus magnuspinnatus]|uniref:succinate dehydrogenase assembly factor 4, mitochondrial n=1 Tax=Periophthalmus magnuspinnatus TaxID=409849 RepID=UPI00145AC5CA|nr:succinate dehydrogenase assembly factor 4, mitochondrial [Periophthalmus magnuspinnatus]
MSLWRWGVSMRRHCASSGSAANALRRGDWRALSGPAKDKEPLKKPNTPRGRFDQTEKADDVLQKFPDDINPVTKEKGGPRGPEPTRYGDWERKGRCVDF